MGILLDSVKFLKKQKSDLKTKPVLVYHVDALFDEDHGPSIQSIINSEFWYMKDPKGSTMEE
ncbi:hypothetical protein P5G65_04260 [Paenibacillus chondroitinus]|uniref:Uncharacterized protein n=1 Tax=Paenibacillus chondroitinus TaxID=59842 RepID=A0ABU6D898_9BACL|nr:MULTISPECIES: hypothetical protein [Paenibacillus]MCY9660044.1 hypothetical protein [Paenibacillus anseongense]MEB4793097.1 hypothetical protein [Paenibacillus chondroitinus]